MSTQPRPTRRAPVAGVNGTDIHEDMPTQEREWRVQRAGWAFMAAIVVAALVGLLGNGPLNERTLTSANGGLQVTYQRFRRLQTPGTLNLKVTPQPGAGQVQVSLNDAYLDAVYVQSVTPEPASVAGDDTRVGYTFALLPGAQTLAVTVRFRPQQFGVLHGEFAQGAQKVAFTQIVYP